MQTLDNADDRCEQLCEHPQAIQTAKARIPSEGDTIQVAEMFKILGDPTRIKILHALSAGELCVCDIAATIAMGQSAVSHQLRLLRTARLVKKRKEGKMVWYSLDDAHIFLLLSQGLEHIQHSR